MSYTPTNWKAGDVITSEKLNKLENGVAAAGSGGGAFSKIVTINMKTYGNLNVGVSGTDPSVGGEYQEVIILDPPNYNCFNFTEQTALYEVENTFTSKVILIAENSHAYVFCTTRLDLLPKVEGDCEVLTGEEEGQTYYYVKVSGDCEIEWDSK